MIKNPYSSNFKLNRRKLRYGKESKKLQGANGLECSDPVVIKLHADFIEKIDGNYPCVFAKSVLNKGSYMISFYENIASREDTLALCEDIFDFLQFQTEIACRDFSTFVAVFVKSVIVEELEFEEKLWRQLDMMRSIDGRNCDWDPAYSSDPTNEDFSFSFGGRGYFVVGGHPRSSRISRRFMYPTIIFNAQFQFEKLKDIGVMDRFREIIRNRDIDMQGNINPGLASIGKTISEARLYSGRLVELDWTCPFKSDN